jgi:UDP-2,3-diacylglucosamine hydrolase
MQAAPQSHELVAPSSWQQIDFISDLHLQESEPANFLAWRRYLETNTADAIFILGDLFELWVGDDLVQMETESHARTQQEGLSFESRCRRALHFCAQRMPLYFIHGNRDFLVGKSFAQSSGMRLLPDPTVLVFGGQRTLLSHGDALCLADANYQIFRAQVRSPVWQQAFLAKPLPERLRIAQELRQQSEARKQQDHAQGKAWIDVDTMRPSAGWTPAPRKTWSTATPMKVPATPSPPHREQASAMCWPTGMQKLSHRVHRCCACSAVMAVRAYKCSACHYLDALVATTAKAA